MTSADLPTAAVVKLRTDPRFMAIVPSLVGSDSLYTQGWVFQRGLARNPEGTGLAAVVVNTRSSWASPNPHNTATFPTLQVEIYADCARDVDGLVQARDADRRCRAVWAVVDRVFHDAANQDHDWDGLRVDSSVRQADLTVEDVPDGDGAVRGTALYAVSLG